MALFLLVATALQAQEGLPEKTLKELKDATAFIKVDGARLSGTGSGFLMRRDGDVGYVVTNAHVVAPGGEVGAIQAVFRSGTRDEKAMSATVVGEDSSRDLAILRVEGKGLPKPIDLAMKVKPRETLPVYILGFPFGERLATGAGNPAVTVGKGSVSSLRLDERGGVALIQIDGDLNPGNSGGPIVDAKGALVGVAVAKLMGTQIGMAIPPSELEEMLGGRVGGITFDELDFKDGVVRYRVSMRLIDPLRRMKSAAVLIAPRDRAKPEPKADEKGIWPALPDAKEHALKIDGDKASAEFSARADLKESPPVFRVQSKYVTGESRSVYTQPADLEVKSAPVSAAAPGAARKPPGKDDDDWLGSEADKKKRDAASSAKPLETGEPLAGEKTTVVDAQVTPIKVDGQNTIHNMVLSADKKFLYTAETRGLVRKISLADFKEERQFALQGQIGWMDRSKEGLLVLCPPTQEIHVLDEGTLAPKRKLAAAGALRFAASPESSIAFAPMGRGDEMVALDLKAGKAVKQYSAARINQEQGKKIRRHKEGVLLSEFGMSAMSPDGKFLFCVGFECLHRFSVNGADLVYEEMGPRIGQNPWRIEISGDSKYVALPSGGGNSNVSDHPQVGSYSTYLYKTSDLQMPVISVSSGAYPRVVGFDKDGGRLYAQNHDHNLITFTLKGLKEKEYKLSTRGPQVRQFLVLPGGGRLLVLSDQQLLHVELPK